MTTKKSKLISLFAIIIVVCLLLSLNLTSGADDVKIATEVGLEKYVNYNLSEDDKGTLVQYNLSMGMEYLSDYNDFPVKESELSVNLNQIDGKYPYDVKVISKSTKATNGKGMDINDNYHYDVNNGILVVKASNQNESGDKIYNQAPSSEAKDEYSIVCYYDTYTAENLERELSFQVSAKAILFKDDREINSRQEFTTKATENISDLTSISTATSEIYNGQVKANIINGTQNDTEYKELERITVSKKEVQQKLSVVVSDVLVKNNEEVGNNGNIIFKNIKLRKDEIKRLLGEDGAVDILDSNSNVVSSVNKDSEWEEDGTITITFENGLEDITVKTSEVKAEGILTLYSTKQIKSTMNNINNNQIKTIVKLTGINEEKTVEEVEKDGKMEQEEKITENKTFESTDEKIIDIKDTTTNVTFNVNNTNWTNRQQNEIVFDICLNSNSKKYNLFKNPTLKINLPSEVEKVILGENSIIYANGLELQNPYVTTNTDGTQSIIANVTGTQMNYAENSLGLATEVKISATIILKKDIEATNSNVNLEYTNQYTLDKNIEVGNIAKDIKIENYKEDNNQENTQGSFDNNIAATAETVDNVSVENADKLKVEVLPVKGDTVIKDGDTVYEGEYIKYNIKVTNTADKPIDNIKVVGSIPDGTTYGELEADYFTYQGKYEYNFDNNVKEKNIEIGLLNAGESVERFYEVRANDLAEGETEKNILTNVKTYVSAIEISNYELTNKIEHADAKIFIEAKLDSESDRWNYGVSINGNQGKEVTVKIKFPKEFEFKWIGHQGVLEEVANVDYIDVLEDNVVTANLNIDNENKYFFEGVIDNTKINKNADESEIQLYTMATVIMDNQTYTANENRITYLYPNASIVMTSPTEGEEVKYEDEIEYNIAVKNTGGTNLDTSKSYIEINVTDFLPENLYPISVTYDTWEEEEVTDEEETVYTPKGNFIKKAKTDNIKYSIKDEDGNSLPNVDIYCTIPYQETTNIKIKAKAGRVYEKTKIENSATITSEETIVEDEKEVTSSVIGTKISNTITHTILPYNYEENIENPDDPNNPNDPNNPDSPSNPDKPNNERYTISGVAWIDENKDGQRQTSEELLEGIEVLLVNAENSNIVSEGTRTSSNGVYNLGNLEAGKYIVVFKYDKDTYRLTEYKKAGVSSSVNSDVTKKNITLNGQEMIVGATDIISLDASNSNIDIGLIKNEICDLKLDKYISKVSVTTKSGTKQYNYNNNKLAKVEIKSKEIEGATVVVEYKLVVTNEGELPASVTKLVDYIPNGLNFSSELNKSWSLMQNGQLVNTSINNRKIESGKSLELSLILNKRMTSNATGTFTNIAEINDMSNELGIKDIDSIPGNKVETEDDYSKADLIISVSTGLFVYISIGIVISVLATVFAMIITKKYKIKLGKGIKIAIFIILVTGIIFLQNINSNAKTFTSNDIDISEYKAPYEAFFAHYGNSQSINFHGGPIDERFNEYNSTYKVAYMPVEGKCIDNGTPNQDKDHYSKDYREYELQKARYKRKVDGSGGILIEGSMNNNLDIYMTELDKNYCILGPFITSMYLEGENDIEVQDTKGGYISDYTICNRDGERKELKKLKEGFYIKIHKDLLENGVDTVTLTNKRKLDIESSGEVDVSATYKPKKLTTTQKVHCNYTIKGTKKRKLTIEDYVEWTNIKCLSSLQVIKCDKDNTNVKLNNVSIRVTGPNNYDSGVLQSDNNGHFKKLDNLIPGTYKITELSNPNYGYTEMVTKSVTVQSGLNKTYELPNEKQTGNLQIVKKDKDNGKALKGISFKIKNSSGQYLRFNDADRITGSVILNSEPSIYGTPTEFTTDNNGIIKICNIPATEQGISYYVEETSVGNEYYGYEVDDNYITWSSNAGSGNGRTARVNVTRKSSIETSNLRSRQYVTLTYENRKKYTKLSGYVWEDDIGKGKLSERNELRDFQGDSQDRPVYGVPVTLKNRVTQKEDTHYTDKDGKYIFEKVLIDDLEDMYIDFTYNGMCYGSVKAKTDLDNGSKASEGAGRAYMDLRYSEVSNSKAEGTMPWGENVKTDLKYDYNEETHMSRLNYECTDPEHTYGGAEYPVTNLPNDSKYIITASTRYAYMWGTYKEKPGYLDKIKTPKEIREKDITEVTNINLGLYKREQPDISVVKDIESAKVQINSRTHVYKYSDRFSKNNEDKFIYGDGHDVAVKFGQKYGNMSYTRALYASDIKYGGDDKLSVKVTYRIQIANQSSSLKVIVNQLADYYDSKYEIAAIGAPIDKNGDMIIDENGDIINDIGYIKKEDYNLASMGYTIEDYDSVYKKSLIKLPSIEIEAGHKLDVYVQMQVKPTEIIRLVDYNDEYVKLDNIAEVISYTTKYQNGGVYGGVDKDSNPGNTIPGKRETYEDDTDSAPGLKLVLQSPRTISGKVFLDDSGDISIVDSGKIRQGDGKYIDGENGIPNVIVKLIRENGEVAKICNANNKYKFEDAIFPNPESPGTDNTGNYSFEGIIPDNYYLEFTWGDKTYRVQDYKSTIVDKESTNTKANNKEWYKDEFKKQYDDNHYANQENCIAQWNNSDNKEYRTSDAIDDYSLRQDIDKQTNYITNENKNAIDSYYKNSTEIPNIKVKEDDDTEKEEKLITKMNSKTNDFNVNIEYNGQNTTTSDEYQTNPDGTIKVENGYAIKKPEFANTIKSIDFGITRRAKQQISIEKRINSVKLKLANGQVIVDAKKDGNGNLKGEMKHTTYIKPDNKTMPRNGFLKLELDNELIQGSVLEVEYEIKAVNTSEVDYATTEFYNYGKGHGQDNIITITPTSIIDYLDKGWMYDNNSTTENGWKVKQKEDIRSYIANGENKESIGNQIILITEKLKDKKLTPMGENTSANVFLKASKTLSTTEEIILDNDTETIIVEKSGGSNIESTPGNYIPGKGPHVESDDDMGEQVIVTPSTGKNLSYIEPITIGVTALIILGTGIVLIKKRVLNKKVD